MNKRPALLLILLSLGIILTFILDIMWGSVSIPAREVIDTLLGGGGEHTSS